MDIRIPNAIFRNGSHKAAPESRANVSPKERTIDTFSAYVALFGRSLLLPLSWGDFRAAEWPLFGLIPARCRPKVGKIKFAKVQKTWKKLDKSQSDSPHRFEPPSPRWPILFAKFDFSNLFKLNFTFPQLPERKSSASFTLKSSKYGPVWGREMGIIWNAGPSFRPACGLFCRKMGPFIPHRVYNRRSKADIRRYPMPHTGSYVGCLVVNIS